VVESKPINKKKKNVTTLAHQHKGIGPEKKGKSITQSILVDRSDVSHPQNDRRQEKVVHKCLLSVPLKQADKQQALQSTAHEKIHSWMWFPKP